jgi:LuxR family maltose regulon positive regulatory protein
MGKHQLHLGADKPMVLSLLQTKLMVPHVRAERVSRARLAARLNARRTLTLVSAPAGSGKTTLVAEWIQSLSAVPAPAGREGGAEEKSAWLSLDSGDDDPIRFWTYVVAALQTVHPHIGETPLAMLQAPQPPPVENVLTLLINEIADLPGSLLLVLDDYHLVQARSIHEAMIHECAWSSSRAPIRPCRLRDCARATSLPKSVPPICDSRLTRRRCF